MIKIIKSYADLDINFVVNADNYHGIPQIIALIIMLAISLFLLFIGFVYLKKAKKYYRDKAELENEQIDETVEDKILQRTCPKCGKSHDIDYPKCPYCKFNYLK